MSTAILLSSDFAVANSLKNGGAGIGQAAVFGPMLLKAGLSEALLQRISSVARRFLAFVQSRAVDVADFLLLAGVVKLVSRSF